MSLNSASLPDAASSFAALGDATRLKLMARLCSSGPQPIVRLTEGSQLTRQAITKHLRALETARLVRSSRVGRERVWAVRSQQLAEVRGYLEQISLQWDEALARLQALVEPA